MVRSETFPFNDYALATPGQLTWVYLNQLLDYDERVRKIHVHCLTKFNQERCEVCGEPIADVSKVDPALQDEIYRPGEDGLVEDFNWKRGDEKLPGVTTTDESEIDVEI